MNVLHMTGGVFGKLRTNLDLECTGGGGGGGLDWGRYASVVPHASC